MIVIENDLQAKNGLLRLELGKHYDEPWLIKHAGFSKSNLETCCKEGYLAFIPKDIANIMSDNQYKLTYKGFKYARM